MGKHNREMEIAATDKRGSEKTVIDIYAFTLTFCKRPFSILCCLELNGI